MTERGTKTLIGAFVMGAVVLLVTGVLLIGSGNFFSKNAEFVLFFNSSLRGLMAGSPVNFKGVRVGKVVSVQISVEGTDRTFRTPVIIELENSLISGAAPGDSHDDDYSFMSNEKVVNDLIAHGLRAQLGVQSVITGQLTVDLDMMRDAPPVSPEELKPFHGLQQIPTLTSSLDAMINVVTQMPIEQIADETLAMLRNINRQLEGLDLPALGASLTALSNEARNQVAELPALRREAVAAMHEVAVLARNADKGLAGTVTQLNKTLVDISSLSAAASKTSNAATRLLREDSAPMLELSQTLQSVRDAAVAVSNLATLLELKPDSLIFGKGRP